jgi:hypothetical protein
MNVVLYDADENKDPLFWRVEVGDMLFKTLPVCVVDRPMLRQLRLGRFPKYNNHTKCTIVRCSVTDDFAFLYLNCLRSKWYFPRFHYVTESLSFINFRPIRVALHTHEMGNYTVTLLISFLSSLPREVTIIECYFSSFSVSKAFRNHYKFSHLKISG